MTCAGHAAHWPALARRMTGSALKHIRGFRRFFVAYNALQLYPISASGDSSGGVSMAAKRTIETETDVFALIWSCRRHGEETENDILRRVLEEYLAYRTRDRDFPTEESYDRENLHDSKQPEHFRESKERKNSEKTPVVHASSQEIEMATIGKIRWVDDVYEALRALGGRAALMNIYREVEKRRRLGNRSVPKTLEATIRRTLEDHSSDSANFRGEDLFANTGRGEWKIRQKRTS